MGTHDIIHPEPMPSGFSERSQVLMFTWLFWNNYVHFKSLGLGRVFHQRSVLFLNVSIGICSFYWVRRISASKCSMFSTLLLCHVPKKSRNGITPETIRLYIVDAMESSALQFRLLNHRRLTFGCGTLPWIPYHVFNLVSWKLITLWWDMFVKPMAEDGAPMNSGWWKTVFWCLSSMIIYVYQICFW